MESLLQDLRYGLRMLRKSPGFTLVAVVTLALGIGANSALFSVVNAVLLRPLPFKDSGRLVAVRTTNQGQSLLGSGPASYPDFADWRQQSTSFDALCVWDPKDYTLTGGGEPVHLNGIMASWNLIQMLGIDPVQGRLFTQQEDEPGASGFTAVLSYQLWQSRFGGDPKIVGQSIVMDGRAYTVVGVAPPRFTFPVGASDPTDVWTTIAMAKTAIPPDKPYSENRGMHWLRVTGRLKPGTSIRTANTELNVIQSRINKQFSENRPKEVRISSEKERVVGKVQDALFVLLGAVGFVLLIACANVANLLLARATIRQKEISIRSALGASRWDLVRQLLTESVLLSLLGGGVGLLLAYWSNRVLTHSSLRTLPRAAEIALDPQVLAFTAAVCVLSGLVFGLAPALQTSRFGISQVLNEANRSGTDSSHKSRVRSALIVSEVALALVLLVGSGLLMQTLWRLQRVDPGFRRDQLVTFELTLPESRYKDPQVPIFYRNLLDRIRALPGVESASAGFGLPMTQNSITVSLQIMERPLPDAKRPSTDTHVVALDYFKTMGIPVLHGRDFNENDRPDSKPVVIVNQAFAKTFFPNEDPIGKTIQTGLGFGPPGQHTTLEIVGVVGNVHQEAMNVDPEPAVFYPTSQGPINDVNVVVHTSLPPESIVPALRQQVWALDKDLPLLDVNTMEQYVRDSMAQPRLNTLLLAIFAGLAFVLTAIGLYGVISYSVAQRTREMGIRIALGAQSGTILKMILGQGIRLALIGVAAGLCGALVLTRLISSMLFGVKPFDALTFIAVAFLLMGIAIFASYIPAARATRIDPVVALRYE